MHNNGGGLIILRCVHLITSCSTNIRLQENADELGHGPLHEIQRQLGGLLVYLECEEKEPLLKFYQEQNEFRLLAKE